MEIFAALIEAVVGIVVALLEAIVGLFIEGAASLGAGELFFLVLVCLAELCLWFFLAVAELIVSLIKWRKPRKVEKPIIWRPKKLKQSSEKNDA
ncbi:MAG: hypothetical protein JXR18_14875 [Neptuniibacter sp.]